MFKVAKMTESVVNAYSVERLKRQRFLVDLGEVPFGKAVRRSRLKFPQAKQGIQ